MNISALDKKKIRKMDTLQEFIAANPNLTPEQFFDAYTRIQSLAKTPKELSKAEILEYEGKLKDKLTSLARKHGVSDYPFVAYYNMIHGQDCRINRGSVVEIYVSIMPEDPRWESTLISIVKNLPSFATRNSLIRRDYLIQIDLDTKKKTKLMFGDRAEVLPMIPKERLEHWETMGVTVKDKKTGKQKTVWAQGNELMEAVYERARFELSREVMLLDKDNDYFSYDEQTESDEEIVIDSELNRIRQEESNDV